jgi:hypothetical protein
VVKYVSYGITILVVLLIFQILLNLSGEFSNYVSWVWLCILFVSTFEKVNSLVVECQLYNVCGCLAPLGHVVMIKSSALEVMWWSMLGFKLEFWIVN